MRPISHARSSDPPIGRPADIGVASTGYDDARDCAVAQVPHVPLDAGRAPVIRGPSVVQIACSDSGLVAAGPDLDREAEVLALAAVALVLLALATLELVGASEPDQQVVAATALQGVVGRGSGDDVLALAAGQVEVDASTRAGLAALDRVVERRALGLLEVVDDVVAVTALGEAQAHVQVDPAGGVRVDDGVGRGEALAVPVQVVIVQPTLDLVGAVAALDEVLAGVTLEVVGVVVSEDSVISLAARSDVVSVAAFELVVAGFPAQGVVPLLPTAEVVTLSQRDRVVVLVAEELILGAVDTVVQAGIGDRVVATARLTDVGTSARVDNVVAIARRPVAVLVAEEGVVPLIGRQDVRSVSPEERVVLLVDGIVEAGVGDGVVAAVTEQVIETLAALDGVVAA